MLRNLVVCCLLMLTGLSAVCARETNAADEDRAQRMLAKAVAYYKEKGDLALATFSRQGEFIDGELYVVVLSTDGVLLASGGSSSILIDRDISDLQDADGKLFVREYLALAAREGRGKVEYRWLNRVDRKTERKVAYIEKVGDKIISVGFYQPHGTPEQARALVDRAAAAMRLDPRPAIAAFNSLHGSFIEDDLYVFVISMDDGIFRAHGGYPRLVGTQSRALRDANGKEFIPAMMAKVKQADRGEIAYAWKNSVTGEVLQKRTYLRKVGRYLIGVGYYLN